MKAPPKILLALTGVAALSLAYPSKVQAVPTMYHYTGNPFTLVGGAYTTSDFVMAMVTLAGPLGANMPLTDVTPTAFILSDRVQTISSSTPNLDLAMFAFATDASGEITSWEVHVNIFVTRGIETVHAGGSTVDQGESRGFGANFDTPGVWTRGHATPDAGSTLSLMTLTLMALGVAARRPASRFEKRSQFFSRAVAAPAITRPNTR